MKRYRSQGKYRSTQLIKARKRFNRRENHYERLRNWKASFGEWQYRAGVKERPPEDIPAPYDFSLIRRPEEAIAHIEEVKSRADTGRVIASDMSFVTDFSSDSIIALIAYANDPKTYRGGRILSKSPLDPKLADKYLDTGIYGAKNLRFRGGMVRKAHGTIYRIRDTTVKGEIAKTLIEFATEKVFGRPQKLKGVYATMVECMNNTFNHASTEGLHREVWWATVYCDTERRVAFFNFLDNGVGILESIKIRLTDSLLKIVGFKDNADLLRDVLEGKIGSRTGLSYRGNGLPEIYKRFQYGQISKLIIIANDAYADVEENEYRCLPTPFRGTFFHWEISYDKHFEPIDDPNFGSQPV